MTAKFTVFLKYSFLDEIKFAKIKCCMYVRMIAKIKFANIL